MGELEEQDNILQLLGFGHLLTSEFRHGVKICFDHRRYCMSTNMSSLHDSRAAKDGQRACEMMLYDVIEREDENNLSNWEIRFRSDGNYSKNATVFHFDIISGSNLLTSRNSCITRMS